MKKLTAAMQDFMARQAEEDVHTEAYELFDLFLKKVAAYQIGEGEAPTDEEFFLWRAAQQKRLASKRIPQTGIQKDQPDVH